MALTQTDIDNLDAAIAASELEVRLEGRLVKYRSTDELLKARAHVERVVRSAGRSKRLTFKPTFTTSRGD